MESVVVATLAGSGEYGSTDGPGMDATFREPCGVCYSKFDRSLLVADQYAHHIRRVSLVPSDELKTRLKHVLVFVLLESGALPVHPLLSVIAEFAIENSMYARSMPRVPGGFFTPSLACTLSQQISLSQHVGMVRPGFGRAIH